MQADELQKWEKIRGKGIVRFVVVRGVLGWGLGAAALFSLITWFATGADQMLEIAVTSFSVFPVAGIFWGASMWWVLKRKYRQQAG